MTFDLDICRAGSQWSYLGQGNRSKFMVSDEKSCFLAMVSHYDATYFLVVSQLLCTKMVSVTSSDSFLVLEGSGPPSLKIKVFAAKTLPKALVFFPSLLVFSTLRLSEASDLVYCHVDLHCGIQNCWWHHTVCSFS